MAKSEIKPKRFLVTKRLRQALMLVGILIITLALSGCEKFVESDVSAEIKLQISQSISETTIPENIIEIKTVKSEINLDDTNNYIYLKNKLNSLDVMLEENKINNCITYGIIDFDNNGEDEFFAVFSNGNQGYNEIKFYSIDSNYNIEFLFSTFGFSRDGETYFMFNYDLDQLLIFSNYKHSYFIMNQKIETVNKNGNVYELFESVWKANSFDNELSQTNAYINSEEVPLNEYNIKYGDFMSKSYYDILYVYDEKLFCGSDLISGENAIEKYVLKKEKNNYE